MAIEGYQRAGARYRVRNTLEVEGEREAFPTKNVNEVTAVPWAIRHHLQ